jgi:hypothetical protein
MKKKKAPLAVFAVLAIGLVTACEVISQPPDIVYDLKLSVDHFTYYTCKGGAIPFAPPERLRVVVTNTGSGDLSDLNVVLFKPKKESGNADFALDDFSVMKDAEGDEKLSGFDSLAVGEEASFYIDFPLESESGKRYEFSVLVGNVETAARKLEVDYGVFAFENDPNFTLDKAYLQVKDASFPEAGDYSGATASTTGAKGDNPWVVSNEDIAEITEDGALSVKKAGTLYVGYLDVSVNKLYGKVITVYPAPLPLDVRYGVNTAGVLQKPQNTEVQPINLVDIQGYAGTDMLVFAKDGPDTVVTLVNANEGTLKFTGASGESDVKVICTVREQGITDLSKTTAETTWRSKYIGTQSFKAKIGALEAPAFVSAETVNSSTDVESTQIDVLFDGTLALTAGANTGDAKNGFKVFKDGTEADVLAALIVNGTKIRLILKEGLTVEDQNISVTYDNTSGVIASANDNSVKASSFAGKQVTNNLVDLTPGPEILSAYIDAGVRENAVKMMVTYDKAAFVTNAAGFAISGVQAGPIDIESIEADPEDLENLTITLKRAPVWSEIEGGLSLVYLRIQGNVKDSAGRPAPDATVPISLLGFDADVYKPPVLQSVTIDGSQNTSLVLVYDKEVTAASASGFSVSGSSTAVRVTALSVDELTITLTLNSYPSAAESGAFKLSYDMTLGNVKDAEGNRAASVTNETIAFTNYSASNTDTIAPWIVSAVVTDAAPTVLQITFSEPVTVTYSLFQVKVNVHPYKTVNISGNVNSALDVQKLPDNRTVTGATAETGTNDTVWNLTMSAPAQFAEILRFTTTAAEGAKDTSSAHNALPAIPEFIVRNEVKRVKQPYEYQAGLYRNGVRVNTVGGGINGDKLFYNALWDLTKARVPAGDDTGTSINPGDVIVISIDRDQIMDAQGPWDSFGDTNSSSNNPCFANVDGATVVITTTGDVDRTITCASGIMAFRARDGLRFVIDKHVIIKRDPSATSSDSHLVFAGDGASIVLDGGEIRDNIRTSTGNSKGGAVTMGGGTRGAYLVINSGKITGNVTNTSNANSGGSNNAGGSGGVWIDQFGAVIMHGGEISNNTLNQQIDAPTARGAGIGCQGGTSDQYHGNAAFFMTGGEIYGNKIIGNAASVLSAGGVMVNGSFQKVGGTIYGSDADPSLANTTNQTGNIHAGAVALQVVNQTNGAKITDFSVDTALSDKGGAIGRDTTAGPDVTLFITSYKPSSGSAAVMTIPSWAESFWEAMQ